MESRFELSPTYGLKESDIAGLIENGDKMALRKGESIVALDGLDTNIYFVTKGILRNYMLVDGNYLTAWFTLPGEFIASMLCYKNGKRSPLGIDAATDADVIKVSRVEFDRWSTASIGNAISSRKLFEGYLSIYEQALLDYFKCSTAKERYKMILRKYPEIVHHIPLKQLASYLWVTPQSLSRIRRNIE